MIRPDADSPVDLDRFLHEHLAELRSFVQRRAGPRLRSKEACSDIVQSACREFFAQVAQSSDVHDDDLASWLYTAAFSKLVQKERYYGAAKRDAARERPVVGNETTPRLDPSDKAATLEDHDRLLESFEELPPDYQEVIVLARIVGLSHEDIAETLGRTVGASKMLLARASARLALSFGSPADDG